MELGVTLSDFQGHLSLAQWLEIVSKFSPLSVTLFCGTGPACRLDHESKWREHGFHFCMIFPELGILSVAPFSRDSFPLVLSCCRSAGLGRRKDFSPHSLVALRASFFSMFCLKGESFLGVFVVSLCGAIPVQPACAWIKAGHKGKKEN